jgi:hypothetical protein
LNESRMEVGGIESNDADIGKSMHGNDLMHTTRRKDVSIRDARTGFPPNFESAYNSCSGCSNLKLTRLGLGRAWGAP